MLRLGSERSWWMVITCHHKTNWNGLCSCTWHLLRPHVGMLWHAAWIEIPRLPRSSDWNSCGQALHRAPEPFPNPVAGRMGESSLSIRTPKGHQFVSTFQTSEDSHLICCYCDPRSRSLGCSTGVNMLREMATQPKWTCGSPSKSGWGLLGYNYSS